MTDKELIKLLDELAFKMKQCTTDRGLRFRKVLHQYLAAEGMDWDQHSFASLPKTGLLESGGVAVCVDCFHTWNAENGRNVKECPQCGSEQPEGDEVGPPRLEGPIEVTVGENVDPDSVEVFVAPWPMMSDQAMNEFFNEHPGKGDPSKGPGRIDVVVDEEVKGHVLDIKTVTTLDRERPPDSQESRNEKTARCLDCGNEFVDESRGCVNCGSPNVLEYEVPEVDLEVVTTEIKTERKSFPVAENGLVVGLPRQEGPRLGLDGGPPRCNAVIVVVGSLWGHPDEHVALVEVVSTEMMPDGLLIGYVAAAKRESMDPQYASRGTFLALHPDYKGVMRQSPMTGQLVLHNEACECGVCVAERKR